MTIPCQAKHEETAKAVSFIFGRCNDYLAREYHRGETPRREAPNIRKDEDIVYSPNKYRETEGIKDTNDPSALFCGFVDQDARKVYVYDELYEKGLTNPQLYERIQAMGYSKERITADSAEPKSIAELRELGLRIRPAAKGRDSINNGIQQVQQYEIIIHPRCTNFITEISNYMWDKDKFGNPVNAPIDDFNHLMDAMRYGVRAATRASAFSFD